MPRAGEFRWAVYGAMAAVALSLLSVALPGDLGGYNAWNDPHGVAHNLAAIATRIIVFAVVGGMLGHFWSSLRRRRAR